MEQKGIIKATGVTAIVVGVLVVWWGLSWTVHSWEMATVWHFVDGQFVASKIVLANLYSFILLGVLFIAFGITKFILGIVIVRGSKSKGPLITLLVLSLLVVAGTVLCAIINVGLMMIFSVVGITMFVFALIALLVRERRPLPYYMDGKRRMIKLTGILAIVFGIFTALGGIFLSAVSWFIARQAWLNQNINVGGWWETRYHIITEVFVTWLIVGTFLALVGIAQFIIGIMVARRSSNPAVNPSACNGLLIAVAVLAFFGGGGWILMVIAIIALLIQSEQQGHVTTQQIVTNVKAQVTAVMDAGVRGLESLIARYKQYKEDGIITEKQYKEKVHDAAEKHFMDEQSSDQ